MRRRETSRTIRDMNYESLQHSNHQENNTPSFKNTKKIILKNGKPSMITDPKKAAKMKEIIKALSLSSGLVVEKKETWTAWLQQLLTVSLTQGKLETTQYEKLVAYLLHSLK